MPFLFYGDPVVTGEKYGKKKAPRAFREALILFGLVGSGKSSLLRKAAADLTVDRRPIAFVDLETFKGHAYPDVLLSVLIETFSKFAEWLETAAIAPPNKTSFWARWFGKKPTRPAFNKAQAKALSEDLRKCVAELQDLLFSEDEIAVEVKQSSKLTESERINDEASLGGRGVKLAMKDEAGSSSEAAQEQSEKYTKNKLQHLHRHILEYQIDIARAGLGAGRDIVVNRNQLGGGDDHAPIGFYPNGG